MMTMTVDELVDDMEGCFFPCTFIDQYDTRGEHKVLAFDIARARDYVACHGHMGECCERIPAHMLAVLSERCLFEELVLAAASRGFDFLCDDCVRVRVTDWRTA